MKPVVSALRRLGICLILYLDDMLIMGENKRKLQGHIASVLRLLIAPRFIVNLKKEHCDNNPGAGVSEIPLKLSEDDHLSQQRSVLGENQLRK